MENHRDNNYVIIEDKVKYLENKLDSITNFLKNKILHLENKMKELNGEYYSSDFDSEYEIEYDDNYYKKFNTLYSFLKDNNITKELKIVFISNIFYSICSINKNQWKNSKWNYNNIELNKNYNGIFILGLDDFIYFCDKKQKNYWLINESYYRTNTETKNFFKILE